VDSSAGTASLDAGYQNKAGRVMAFCMNRLNVFGLDAGGSQVCQKVRDPFRRIDYC
jgi:hypothetical protein